MDYRAPNGPYRELYSTVYGVPGHNNHEGKSNCTPVHSTVKCTVYIGTVYKRERESDVFVLKKMP